MNLEYVFAKLPEHNRMEIKAAMATQAVQSLFHEAMLESEMQLKHIDIDILPDQFKLRYLELKKSVQAYESILDLIHKLKNGELK